MDRHFGRRQELPNSEEHDDENAPHSEHPSRSAAARTARSRTTLGDVLESGWIDLRLDLGRGDKWFVLGHEVARSRHHSCGPCPERRTQIAAGAYRLAIDALFARTPKRAQGSDQRA